MKINKNIFEKYYAKPKPAAVLFTRESLSFTGEGTIFTLEISNKKRDFACLTHHHFKFQNNHIYLNGKQIRGFTARNIAERSQLTLQQLRAGLAKVEFYHMYIIKPVGLCLEK